MPCWTCISCAGTSIHKRIQTLALCSYRRWESVNHCARGSERAARRRRVGLRCSAQAECGGGGDATHCIVCCEVWKTMVEDGFRTPLHLHLERRSHLAVSVFCLSLTHARIHPSVVVVVPSLRSTPPTNPALPFSHTRIQEHIHKLPFYSPSALSIWHRCSRSCPAGSWCVRLFACWMAVCR